MNIFKAIAAFFARLFKKKKELVAAEPFPEKELPEEFLPTQLAPTIEGKELSTKKSFVPKVRSWEREYSQKQDERETVLHVRPPISLYSKDFIAPVFDATKRPNKYWRRFKRNGKIYYKKFYTEPSL